MNTYTAIMKAADSIEKYPHLFSFNSIRVPDHGCGTPGCALGWIAKFAGIGREIGGTQGPGIYWCLDRVQLLQMIGVKYYNIFYKRLESLNPNWRNSATDCAAALRLYAEMYYWYENHDLPVKHEGIPNNVRQIFNRAIA